MGIITLKEALDKSIKGILANFRKDWLVTHESTWCGNADITHHIPSSDFIHEKISRPEAHEFIELCIGLEGTFAMLLEDKTTCIAEGDICLIIPGVIHKEMPIKENPYLALWVMLDISRTTMHLSGKNKENDFFYTIDGYISNNSHENHFVFNGIRNEMTAGSHYSSELIKSYILQFLIILLRKTGDTNRKSAESWKESFVMRVQKYVEINYANNLKLNDISREFCISVNYLNHIFKSITNSTIMNYIEHFRMERAKELLKNTSCSTMEIAAKVGYSDQFYFSRAFKKASGITPTQFRKLK